jgi:hypothetical protein
MAYDGNIYTVICCDAYVYAANGDYTTITDITPSPAPTGGALDFWEFTIVAGLPILTNGKDPIWKWPDPNAALTVLLNAPVAKHISCCMHRLVCSNVFDNGVYTGRVKWSAVGNPEFWIIDTSKKSGRFDLVNYQDGEDTQHNIMCQITDGSKTCFFTERNLWVCDFAQQIKQFTIVDGDFQILSPRSAVLDRGNIYAIDKRDIYRFTASRGALFPGGKEPIGTPSKKELFATLNVSAINSAFAFSMFGANEIWFCVSTGSNTVPDTAFIYNWELSTPQNPVWSIQDVDFLCHARAYPPAAYVAWTGSGGAPISWTGTGGGTIHFLQERYNAIARDIVGDSASHILLMDSGFNAIDTSLDPQPIDGVIESGDMVLGSRMYEKIMEELFPDLLAQSQTNSLMIQVGTRNSLSMPIQWSPVSAFRIGVDNLVDLRSYGSEGAFARIRFYTSIADSPWSLGSYSFKFSLGAEIR